MNRFLSKLDQRYAKIFLYAGVTVLLTAGACMLLVTVSPVAAKIWELVCTVLEPIVYGAALSYVLNPLVKHVSGMLRSHNCFTRDPMLRRRVAVAISLVIVLLVLAAISAIFVLMVTHSIASLNIAQIQSLLGSAQGDLIDLLRAAHERLVGWGILAQDSATAAPLALVNGVKEGVTTALFAIIFGVYFLIDGPYVVIYIGRVAYVLFGDDIAVNHGRFIADADKVFSGYFRGQGIDAAVVGVTSGIVLTAIGVPFGPLVGLLAGLGNLIPYVGGPVGFGSIALVCLPNAAWGKMIAGFVAMGLIMVIDANVINPKLLSDNVEVHPILVLAALIGGGAVGGIAGMLVAVPFAAFLKIQLDRWVDKREAEEVERYTRELDALEEAARREAEEAARQEAEAAQQETAKGEAQQESAEESLRQEPEDVALQAGEDVAERKVETAQPPAEAAAEQEPETTHQKAAEPEAEDVALQAAEDAAEPEEEAARQESAE